jgi:hypothetical protein
MSATFHPVVSSCAQTAGRREAIVEISNGRRCGTRKDTAMNTQTQQPQHRTRTRIVCLVAGHKWSRQRRPDRTVLLTCRRCGHVDVVEKDLDFGPFFGGIGGAGPLG